MRQLKTNESFSGATTEKKTETASRRLWTLSNETARHRQLLAARMSSKAVARGRNLPHLGVGWPSDSGRPVETDAGIDAAMSISRPDCNNTADVPSLTLRKALSAIPCVSDLCGVDVQ